MKSSVKSTNKYDKAQIDMGFKKVHIWVPIDKVDEIKWQAKLLRDTHKLKAHKLKCKTWLLRDTHKKEAEL